MRNGAPAFYRGSARSRELVRFRGLYFTFDKRVCSFPADAVRGYLVLISTRCSHGNDVRGESLGHQDSILRYGVVINVDVSFTKYGDVQPLLVLFSKSRIAFIAHH